MMKTTPIFLLLFLFVFSAAAQCPTSSRPGVHVVQANETLYRIAITNRVSVDQICEWNGITRTEVLTICKELKLTPPANTANASPATSPSSFNTTVAPPPQTNVPITTPNTNNTSRYRKQSGKNHIVQPGETFAGIAYLYGYTEPRFREINPIPAGREVTPGSVLLSTDCDCPRISYNNDLNAWTNPTGTNTGYNPTTYNPTSYNPPTTRPTTNPTATNPTGTRPFRPSGVTGNQARPTTPNTNPATSPAAPSSSNTAAATYMRPDERAMIDEINLMRRNPRGYIPFVQEYVRKHKSEGWDLAPDYDNYVNSLISALNASSQLPELSPKPCLYDAARGHGQDMARTGIFDHTGSDRSQPYQRINKACGGRGTSAENLGMGSSARDAVMELLIDDGVPGYGHRVNLMNPEYRSFAAFRVNRVGTYDNVWVQVFSASPGAGGSASTGNSGPSKGDSGSYMKSIEMDMVKEINLMRSNPRAYVRYVQAYANERKRVWGQGPSPLYLNELIRELNALQPLSILQANQCIYNTARNHGEDQKASGKGDVDHRGRDGRSAYDRITQSCNFLTDGTENLVAGKNKVRDAVIVLLIDEGISNRGHRKALLNPNWKYIACYRIGQVGTWNDYWVQNFGY